MYTTYRFVPFFGTDFLIIDPSASLCFEAVRSLFELIRKLVTKLNELFTTCKFYCQVYYSAGSYNRVLMIDLTSHFYSYQLVELIEKNKTTCMKAAKAIPLTIVQRRRTQAPSERALSATNIVCRVCHGSIMGISFRCSECEDYNMFPLRHLWKTSTTSCRLHH